MRLICTLQPSQYIGGSIRIYSDVKKIMQLKTKQQLGRLVSQIFLKLKEQFLITFIKIHYYLNLITIKFTLN